ncbi:MAG: hypothetical protein IT307_16865 [Chloroflexi bacterium]|nr:hypothetical protein [Chloroflexota bacterium]
MEGGTVSPDGSLLVALNKWSVDRFAQVGPLLPQDFRLIDISQPDETKQLLDDMPLDMAEPHCTQIIPAERLRP